MGANVGTAYVTIQPSMKGFASSISGEVSSVGSSAGTKFSSTFKASGVGKIGAAMGAVAGVAGKVATAAFSAIGNSMGNAISRVDTLANFPKVMSNLGYSSEEASASIQKISKSLDGLPSSTDNVASMVQQLAPMCSSLSEATDLGLALNNMFLAGGASAADCSRAMQQYTQILNKGKPDLQDWKTLQEVMPGQLNQVAQALLGAGKNSSDLYEALKAGTLTMDDFNSAVMKLNSEGVDGFASFEQQAKDATQGIATAMDNVQNRISAALAKLINAFGENRISGAINAFSGSFGTIADKLVPAFTLLGNASEAMANKIGSALSKASAQFNTLISPLTGQLNTATSAFSAFANTIKTRFSVMGQTMNDTFQSVINQVQSGSLRLSLLTATFNAIKTSLAGIFDDTPAGEYVAKVRAKLEQLVAPIGNSNFFQSLFGENFGTLPAGLQAMFTSLDSGLQNVSQLANTAGASLSNFWNTASSKLSAVNIDFSGIGTSLMNGLGTALEIVTPKIQAIAEFIKTTFGAVVEFVQTIATGISEAFGSFNIDSLATLANFATLVTPMGLLKEVLVQIGGTLSGTISGVLQTLAPLIVTIVQTALNLIESLAPSLGSLATIIASTLVMGIQTIASVLQTLNLESLGQSIATIGTIIGTNISTFAGVFASVIPVVSQLVVTLLPTILSLLPTVVAIIVQLLSITSQVGVALAPIISQLLSSLVPVIGTLVQAVTPLIQAVLSFISSLLPLIQAILPIITDAISIIVSVLTAIIPIITTVISVVTLIMTVVIEVINTVISVVTPIISFVLGVVSSITGAIADIASVISSIIQVVATAVSTIISTVSKLVSKVVGFFVDLAQSVSTKITNLWNDVKNVFSTGVNTVIEFVRSIPSSILNFFNNAGNLLINAGKSIIDGLIKGIKNAAKGAVDAVKNVVSSIRDFFPFSPAKDGPFSGKGYTTYSGRALMKGFADGIAKQAPATARMIEDTMAGLNSLINAPQAQFALATNAQAYKGTMSLAMNQQSTTEQIIDWLDNNLGAVIKDNTPQDTKTGVKGGMNVNLNYTANDDARTMFTDLVGRLETLDNVRGA